MSWKDQESAASIRLRSIFLPFLFNTGHRLALRCVRTGGEGEGDKGTALYIFFASRPCLPSHVIFFERAGRALQLGSSVKGFGAEGKIKLTNLWMRIGGRRGEARQLAAFKPHVLDSELRWRRHAPAAMPIEKRGAVYRRGGRDFISPRCILLIPSSITWILPPPFLVGALKW